MYFSREQNLTNLKPSKTTTQNPTITKNNQIKATVNGKLHQNKKVVQESDSESSESEGEEPEETESPEPEKEENTELSEKRNSGALFKHRETIRRGQTSATEKSRRTA